MNSFDQTNVPRRTDDPSQRAATTPPPHLMPSAMQDPPNHPHINISALNIDGINRKYHALKNFIETDKIQILALSETKTSRQIKINNFTTYYRPSTMQNARGTALLILSKIPSTPHILPDNLANLEATAANVLINNLSITIISYYNPPSENLSIPLLQYFSNLPNAILLGDFNARHKDFGDHYSNRNGITLTNNLLNLPIYRTINRQPTFINHRGSSIIDHILITESLIPLINPTCTIGTTATSPHQPLITQILQPAPPPPPTYVPIFDYKHADWQKFKNFITQNLPQFNPTRDPEIIDHQVSLLTDTISTAKHTSIQIKHITKHKRPLPQRILKLIKLKRKLFRTFVRTRDPFIKTHFNRLNAQIRRDINQYREEQWSNACAKLDYRDGKQYWNTFKAITGQKTQKTHYLKHNGTFLTSPQDQANLFAETLQSIHTTPQNPNFNQKFFQKISQEVHNFRENPPNLPVLPDDDLSNETSPDEVLSHIKRLKNSKAPGPDEIKPILLKNLPEPAIQALTTIINNCLASSYFPKAWKSASTIMIPKPGKDPHDPLSYRPISLLNVMGKIFEKILASRLAPLLESHRLLPDQQFGFRSQRSTINPLMELHTDSTRHSNLKECTAAVFLDIERAFDKVWHDGLIHKLISLQLNPAFIQLIDSFLSNRSCKVKILNTTSTQVNIEAGVPQGSVLSPIMYLIYCSDFPFSDTTRTKSRMFADDTAFWTSHRSPIHASATIQGLLHRFEKWANNWRISPNPKKSQSILISYPRANTKQLDFSLTKLTLHNQPIPKSKSIKYLGITFSRTCSLLADLELTLKKVRNRANLLSLIRGRIRGCNPKTLLFTYKSFIRPIIEYRAPLYASLSQRSLNKISACERKILRRILKLDPNYPSMHVHSLAKTPPITSRLTELQQKYINRTLNSTNPIAIQTLHTSHKYPTVDNRLLNRIPKKPKTKFKHPPTALLTSLYPNIPEALQSIVEETPLPLR